MGESGSFVITISRQLGSGGSYLGQRLASRLAIAYLDREILRRAAQTLGTTEDILAARDERERSFWETFLEGFAFGSPEGQYVPPPFPMPTTSQLWAVEKQALERLARDRSCVVVGRGGFHMLTGHPRHMSVFVYAELDFRIHRTQEIYGWGDEPARAQLERSDRERARFHQSLTHTSWEDARQYDVCLCTSRLGLELAEQLLMAAALDRFELSHP